MNFLRILGIAWVILPATIPVVQAQEIRVISSPADICMQLASQGQIFVRISNYSELALKIVRQIQSHCVQQVGDLNLTRLADEFSELKAYIFTAGFFGAGEAGTRETGVCDPKEKRVLLSCYSWQQSGAETREIVALHEALCAAGYVDDDYQLAVGLWQLAKQLGMLNDQRSSPFRNIGRRTETPRFPPAGVNGAKGLSGGVTNVGGGGDAFAVDVKVGVLEKISESLRKPGAGGTGLRFSRIMDRIINAQIEIDNTGTAEKGTVTFGKTDDGRLSMRVPRSLFGPDQSIEQIIAYLLEHDEAKN